MRADQSNWSGNFTTRASRRLVVGTPTNPGESAIERLTIRGGNIRLE